MSADACKLAEDALQRFSFGPSDIDILHELGRALLATQKERDQLTEYFDEHGDPRALRAEVAEARAALREIVEYETALFTDAPTRALEIAREALAAAGSEQIETLGPTDIDPTP